MRIDIIPGIQPFKNHQAIKIVKGYKRPITKEIANFIQSEHWNEYVYKVCRPIIHKTIEVSEVIPIDVTFVVSSNPPFDFTPKLPIISTQKISIEPFTGSPSRFIYRHVIVNNIQLSEEEIEEYAINDGFDNVEEFWQYHIEPFKGRILHLTDKLY